jgi:hypothetical protein
MKEKEKTITAIIDFIQSYLPRFLWRDDVVDSLYHAFIKNDINLLNAFNSNNSLFSLMYKGNMELWHNFINFVNNYYKI